MRYRKTLPRERWNISAAESRKRNCPLLRKNPLALRLTLPCVRRNTMRRKAHERRKRLTPRRCGMVLPQGSARPPACNLPRKNVPIPHLESTSTVPTVRRTNWMRQKQPSPQRKFSVPSVFLTRQSEKAKRSFTLKKWRNAPMDAYGTIHFPGRSMRSSMPPMRRCMRWNRKMWVLRLDTRARC